MRLARLIITTTILLTAAILVGQGPNGPRPPQKPSRPAEWNPKLNQTYIAYWTVEPGWSTTLEIRNNAKLHDIAVTPVLRTSDGNEISLAPVTVSSEQVVGVDLRQALSTAAPQLIDKLGSFGSAICRFSSNASANIFASTIVQHPGTPISFHFDESDVDGRPDQETIESIWWLAAESSTDMLVLANASTKPVSTVVTATDAVGHSYSQNVSLAGEQVERVDLRTLARQGGASNAMGGLTISTLKGAGSLIVSHFAYDETTGLSAIMKTFERDPSETPDQHTLRAPMLALATPDPTMGFPLDVQLIPQLLLRNTTAQPINVSVLLNWHSVSTNGQVPVSSAALAPGEVRIVNLADIATKANVPGNAYWGTLTVKYQGRYGDIVPIASSFDASGKYGMQTPFEEGLNRLWKGSMWHVDSMRNSIITAGNGGTEPTKAAVTLFYNGGKSSYTVEQLLQPEQQMWLDMASIIRNQTPDKDGKTIPLDVMMGAYELRDLDHRAVGQLFEGKLVIDKTWGHGYYGCAVCCGYERPNYLYPNPYTGIVGNGTWDTIFVYEPCESQYDDVTQYGYNWTSDNTPVATVANAYTSLAGVGSANASSSVQLNGYKPLGPRCPTIYLQQSAPVQSNSDPTPNITSINPNPWNAANSPIRVQIFGSGFGTNPSVSITDPQNQISVSSKTPVSDGEVDVTVTIGANDSGENATITVTSAGYNGFGFVTSQGNSPTSSGFGISVNPIPAPVPQIIYKNNNVVGGPAQPVVIGQQILLSSSVNVPSGTFISSQSWTIQGTYVGGYSATNSGGNVIVPVLTNPTALFYWTYAGSSNQVQNQVTYSYCLNNNTCNSATATFTVYDPNITKVTAPVEPVWINPSSLILEDGDFDSANYGIRFTVQATAPQQAGLNNNYLWVQLPSQAQQIISCAAVTQGTACTGIGTYSCVPKQTLPALDTVYPYSVGETANDSPATEMLGAEGEYAHSLNFTAQMYLLWDPALNANGTTNCSPASSSNGQSNPSTCTGSIPVPLGSITWGASGSASNANGNGWVLSNPNPAAAGNGPSFQSGSSFPQWGGFITGGQLSDTNKVACTKL